MPAKYMPVALVNDAETATRMKNALILVGIDASVRAFSCKWEVLTSVNNRYVGNLLCSSMLSRKD